MEELELLSPAFRDRLDWFSRSVAKRKIVKYWSDKSRYCRSPEDRIRLFLSIKPLIEHAYKEENPEGKPDYERLLDWITDCATASDIIGDIPQRDVWIEIFDACEWVYYLSSFLSKRNFQVSNASVNTESKSS